MGSFLKTTLAVIFGLCITSFFAFIVFVSIIASFGESEEKVELKNKSVLHLKFNKEITEVSNDAPWEELGMPFPQGGAGTISLKSLKHAINKAKDDSKIEGILIDGGNFKGGFGIEEEVRNALLDFKSSGKFIYSYADYMSEKGYYIHSVADEIYLNPAGLIEFNGFSVELQYFKDFFDKIGVKAEVFKVGKYKSAVEPLSESKISEANKEQINVYLNSLHEHYLSKISESRGVAKTELKNISDNMLVRNPKDAEKYRLVTSVGYKDQIMTVIKEEIGLEPDSKINFVSFKKYSSSIPATKLNTSANQVAVLLCEGEIRMDGKDVGVINGNDVAERLRKLKSNQDIKAVVLRVNSPGGSALASDIMWREVQLLKEQKPVIASMSSLAASGGYYMSMGCDKIVAYPNTITGSIGIFGVGLNPTELLDKKWGIHTYSVSTGKYSNFMSMLDDLNNEEKVIIQQGVNEGYEMFTSKAAEGRKMPINDLLKVAEGRVWTGIDAKKIGLVDELGGIDTAIELAAKEAGVEDDYDVVYYPKDKDFFEVLFENLSDDYTEYKVKAELGELYPVYKQVKSLLDWNTNGEVQARLPYSINIK